MEIPEAYGSFEIVRKTSEVNEANMPNNVVEAIILFKKTNEVKCLEETMACMEKELAILAAGPDGKSQINIGFGCLCWDCGFCSLPKNRPAETEGGDAAQTLLPSFNPVCAKCGNTEHVNMIQCKQADGSVLPWIELVPNATSEK